MSDGLTRFGSPGAVPTTGSDSSQSAGASSAGVGGAEGAAAAASNGPPYPSTVYPVGGLPTVAVDDPISAVLLVFFVMSAALHMARLQLNRRRGRKFLFSGMMFAFSTIRSLALVMRISWASFPHNVRIAIAANIFTQAGTVVVFIVNLFLSQRLLRGYHPEFGWSTPVRVVFRGVLVCVIGSLIMVISVTVQSFYTLDTTARAIDRKIQLVAGTFLTVLAFLPIPIVAIAALVPRRSRPEFFGEGSWRAKLVIIFAGASVMTLGAGFRVGTNWNPRPLTDTNLAWYDMRAPYYIFNFVLDLLVSYLYLGLQFDRRFHIPNGADRPGSYGASHNGTKTSLVRESVIGRLGKKLSMNMNGEGDVEKHHESEDELKEQPTSDGSLKKSPGSGSDDNVGQTLGNDSQGTLFGSTSAGSGAISPPKPLEDVEFPVSLRNHAAVTAARFSGLHGGGGRGTTPRTEAGNSETLVGTSTRGESLHGRDNVTDYRGVEHRNRGGSRVWGSEGLRLTSTNPQRNSQRQPRESDQYVSNLHLDDNVTGALAWEAANNPDESTRHPRAGRGGNEAGLSTTTSDDESDWRTARMGYSSSSPSVCLSRRPSEEISRMSRRRSQCSDRQSTRGDATTASRALQNSAGRRASSRRSMDSQTSRRAPAAAAAATTTTVDPPPRRFALMPTSPEPDSCTSPEPEVIVGVTALRPPQYRRSQPEMPQKPPVAHTSPRRLTGGSNTPRNRNSTGAVAAAASSRRRRSSRHQFPNAVASSSGSGSGSGEGSSSPDLLLMSGARQGPPPALTPPQSAGSGSSGDTLNARGTSERRRVRSSRASQQMRRKSITVPDGR